MSVKAITDMRKMIEARLRAELASVAGRCQVESFKLSSVFDLMFVMHS